MDVSPLQRRAEPSAGLRGRILFIDDDPTVHTVLQEVLTAFDCDVHATYTVAAAMAVLDAGEPIDLLVTDKNLPDGTGLEVARSLKDRDPLAEVVVMSAFASLDSALEAVKLGVFDFITKPFDDVGKLERLLQNAMDKALLRREQQRLLARLMLSEERYALAARASNDGLWEWSRLSDTVYYSDRWKEMLGYGTADIGASLEEWLSRVHPDDIERVRNLLGACFEGRIEQFEDEHRVLHRDATYRWMLTRGIATKDPAGRPQRLVGSHTDVTDRRLAEQQMQYDMLHDAVTHLPNRVLFLDRVGQALARVRRRKGYRFAVLLLDLDRFKIVNESLGHSFGDELLVVTARRLEGCLRPGDTVARLGGDEFAILIDEVREVADATRVAERVQNELTEPLALAGKEVFTTSSIGIALSTESHHGPEELLRDADIAMYRAKALGKAQYVVFEATMHGRAERLLDLDTDLRRAIERHEFRLHYQPIVSLERGRIVGFEALVRWQHPERGLVGPMEFIPQAEDTGLIASISQLVLVQAVKQTVRWQHRFPMEPRLSMSVNISGKQLSTPGLADDVKRVLRDSRLPASSLRLEITESAVMENASAAAQTLEALKALDVLLYMDDFGTGYSSLSYLHSLPIDTVKIDRAFVSDLGGSADKSVIVHTIVTLARVLGLEVIAEGIETEQQLSELRALKCDHGQGYFFSRPLPCEEIEDLLSRKPQW